MAQATESNIRGGQPPISETLSEERPERLPLGPLKNIHVFWMAGMSCDGCTITVAGATNPGIEGLLTGTVPAMPKMLLHHPVLSVEAGAEFMQSFKDAHAGTLGDPYVVVFEGSVPDERIAARTGGYWSAMGSELMAGEVEGGDYGVAEPVGAGRCGHDRHRHLRNLGWHSIGRRQPHQRDECDGFLGQGLPQCVRFACHQHSRMRTAGRQLHGNRVRHSAVPARDRAVAFV
jgi:hypothetical protein